MASTPDILSKLNVGSGMNNSDIISSLVEAERAPALDRIEKNETATKNMLYIICFIIWSTVWSGMAWYDIVV